MDFKYLYFGILIFGFLAEVFANPAPQDSNLNGEDEMDDIQNDYNEPNDYNENVSMPESPPTMSSQKPAVASPYFEKDEYLKQVKPQNDITLECPVKNFGKDNVVLWYKEDKVIVAGSKPVGDRYSFSDMEKSLTIFNTTEKDSGNYYCEILPGKIRLHVGLEVSELSNHALQSSSNIIRPTLFLSTVSLLLCATLLRI